MIADKAGLAANLTPADCAEWLEGSFPRPVEDSEQWMLDED